MGEAGKELSSFGRVAEGKRTMLDNASDLKDLFSPTGNRLERLKGDRAGQHSIRINDQGRIYLSGSSPSVKAGVRARSCGAGRAPLVIN